MTMNDYSVIAVARSVAAERTRTRPVYSLRPASQSRMRQMFNALTGTVSEQLARMRRQGSGRSAEEWQAGALTAVGAGEVHQADLGQ